MLRDLKPLRSSPICLNSYAHETRKTFPCLVAVLMMLFQTLLILRRWRSPTTTQRSLALERATFSLLPSPTKPIVCLRLGRANWPYLWALTELNTITRFSLPWKESIVFISHFPPAIFCCTSQLTWAV